MKKLILLLVAGVFLFSACSDDDPESTALPSGGTLSGNWALGCTPTSSNESLTLALVLTGTTFSTTTDSWLTSTTCAGTSSFTSVNSGTLALQGVSPSLSTATRVDSLDTADMLTVNDSTAAAAFNATSQYGFTDWTVGTAKDILNLDASGASDPETTDKDIFSINEAADPDQLSLGLEEDDGGTLDSDGYPTTLDSSFSFTRS